tara:strand:- start:329 stop:1444 length:1116 start_codon:yes stop_codon:yes gene_type:complete
MNAKFLYKRNPFVVLLVISVLLFDVGTVQSADTIPDAVEIQQTVEDVELIVKADRKEIGIADQLKLTFTIFTPVGRLVAFPNVRNTLGPFRVVGHDFVRPQAASEVEREEWKQQYLLEADSVGEKTIRSMMITISAWSQQDSVACRLLDRGSAVPEEKCDRTRRNVTPPETVTVKTPTLEFLVTTVLADDADITTPMDIAPPVSIIKQPMPLGIWALLLGMAVFIGLCLWWLLRRQRAEVSETVTIGTPVHLIILELLEKLKREDIDGAEAVDHFYVRLSSLLRRYALWRFGVSAIHLTTEELVYKFVASDKLPEEHSAFIEEFFRHCDAVKFARYQPTNVIRNRFVGAAVQFVTGTGDNNIVIPLEEAKL